MTKVGKDQITYFEMIFGFVTLTSLDIAASTGSDVLPTANASLAYQQVTLRYRPQKADGTYAPFIEGTFNLVNNAVVFSGDANVLTGLFESGGSVNLEFDGPPLVDPIGRHETRRRHATPRFRLFRRVGRGFHRDVHGRCG